MKRRGGSVIRYSAGSLSKLRLAGARDPRTGFRDSTWEWQGAARAVWAAGYGTRAALGPRGAAPHGRAKVSRGPRVPPVEATKALSGEVWLGPLPRSGSRVAGLLGNNCEPSQSGRHDRFGDPGAIAKPWSVSSDSLASGSNPQRDSTQAIGLGLARLEEPGFKTWRGCQ